jgi:FtsP/CotA-like multicopper oxidase with cupredoxin domain
MLVNGETGWRANVRRGEVVRFFLTNASNTRTFNVVFGEGTKVKVIGGDFGNYARESRIESVVIAPAERYVVEVSFERPGEVAIVNRVRAIDHLYARFFADVDTLGVVNVSSTLPHLNSRSPSPHFVSPRTPRRSTPSSPRTSASRPSTPSSFASPSPASPSSASA